MEKFNLTIKGERGEIKLENCTNFPTKEQFEQYIEKFETLSIGKAKKFIFDEIR